MKSEVGKLKEELAPVYKDKARLTEELMQCRESLTRVRDTNALQDKSLNEATGRIRDLKSRSKELSQQVDAERATQALAATELEVGTVTFWVLKQLDCPWLPSMLCLLPDCWKQQHTYVNMYMLCVSKHVGVSHKGQRTVFPVLYIGDKQKD